MEPIHLLGFWILYEELLEPFWEGIEEIFQDFGQYLQVSSLEEFLSKITRYQ